MQDLTVALFQVPLAWEDPAANRKQMATRLSQLPPGVDLAVLPEMFTTGFSMDAERVAEDDAAVTLPWLQARADSLDMALCGSLPVRATDGRVHNRLLYVTPGGEAQHYDKKHCFRMSGEHEHYSPGSEKLLVEWRGWRLLPQVCYDLRFPVWLRNRPAGHPEHYDALLFVANWPAKRRYHWRQLLIARAIENQACCIGVNRVGEDGNGISYAGDSLAIAADGKILLDCEEQEGVFIATLEQEPLTRYRDRFPCHLDADDFLLK